MEANVRGAIEEVERVITDSARSSKQPRFQPGEVYASVLRWVNDAALEEPSYQADSRKRDTWLRRFWRKEPHLAGVLDSVTAIDKNRSWLLTGGRNQVARYQRILREVEGGQGWRYFASEQALSYYTADIGSICEVGRDGEDGPLRALFHVDSTRCRLMGDVEQPLEYRPARAAALPQRWYSHDFFRCVSMPDGNEEMYGLGYCALSRCLELAKLMVAVYHHDLEQLGQRAPKGLMLLRNISQDQWDEAMTVREAQLNNRELEYFGGVFVLASAGPDDIDAKLIALSKLPDSFSLEVFTEQLMYGYALCFGCDPIEFWPVQAGAIGRGMETEIQHKKATSKGGMDFALNMQDHLQRELPDALSFIYEQRDEAGKLIDAQISKAWVDVANALYLNGDGLLTAEQAKSLLVEKGIIPSAWTETEEDVQADAEGEKLQRQKLLENEAVQRAVARYADEPIVQYRWPDHRWRTIWQRGSDAYAHFWRVTAPRQIQRQEDEILFENEEVSITESDVDRAIALAGERVSVDWQSLMDNDPIIA